MDPIHMSDYRDKSNQCDRQANVSERLHQRHAVSITFRLIMQILRPTIPFI